jgi:DNA-binding SARP family transcriptional activator
MIRAAATDALSNGYGPPELLEFRILGPLEVVGDQGLIRLAGPRQRATLAILLLNANRVVAVEQIADELYAGAPPVTAVTQVQRQISELRRLLGSASVIETRPPGYVIRLSADQLDVERFERSTEDASRALASGRTGDAADLLRKALTLWRGAPLADFAYDAFAQTAIARLEELRLVALEHRIEADLLLGRDAELVAELEELVADHPLHERFRGQLMLALYRSGRQAAALEVYRRTRAVLMDELGLEPTPALQKLQLAILAQEPTLTAELADPGAAHRLERVGAILLVPADEVRLEAFLAIAEPLARLPGRELIIARLLKEESELERVAAAISARRSSLQVTARTAVFTTLDPAGDVVRLAAANDVVLVIVDAPAEVADVRFPEEITALFDRSPADVALLAGTADPRAGAAVFVPFGGSEHDWAALELGAWLALATDVPLQLVGKKADLQHGQRDASRLLADASLAIQRLVGVETGPLLVESDDLLDAVEDASVIVVGVSSRWRSEGLGETRRELVRSVRRPVLLVHGGPRPGGLAPPESRTRYTWSLAH